MSENSASRLTRFVPGVAVITGYRRSWFRPDLLAGVTVWAMLVPQSLGYATLAGLPTVNGLYAAVGGLLLYWLWGSSRELNVGPEGTVAIMVATILGSAATAGSDDYVNRAALLAIMVGIVLLIGGLLRLGRVADFLSRPVLAGYVFGSGILIIISQLPELFGIDVDVSLYATDLGAILRNLGDADPLTLGVGIATIVIIVAFKRWVPAVPGALIAVAVSMIAVAAIGLNVAVVGAFPSGVPVPGLPGVPMSDALKLIGPAFAVALLVYPDSVLTGRSLSAIDHHRLDSNREFFGIGAANIGAGLLGGFAVNGSQSRSFVLADAGGKTQVANLWAAGLAVVTMLLFAPIFEYLPLATLAGIVIVAGFGLLDTTEFSALWQYRRAEFWMALVTIVAVLVIGMLGGILVAVCLSMLAVVLRAASPNTAVLGRLPGTDTYRNAALHDDTETISGLLIYRFDADIFFANAGHLRDDILSQLETAPDPVTLVLVDAEPITDIDSTGAQIISELLDSLDAKDIGLSMARVRTQIQDELDRAEIADRLALDGIYLEVGDGVHAFRSQDQPT